MVGCISADVPVLPPSLTDMGEVIVLEPRFVGEWNEFDTQTLVNEKPHLTP
jgi:hypothetical protein